ncbi:hypothetical protein MMPV_006456 [Pyropia vietnamensis]
MRAFATVLAVAAAAAAVVAPAVAAHGGYFIGYMSGHQQVPPVATRGTGRVLAFRAQQTLFIKWTFAGLTTPINESIGIHIHEGLAGANGPVIFPLTDHTRYTCKDRTCGVGYATLTLSKDQTEALEARGLYFNLHTEKYPGGELRAALVPNVKGARLLSASLTTGAANPGNPDGNSMAFGGAIIEIMQSGSIVVSGSYEMLSDRLAVDIAGGAHLHMGITGMNGPVVIVLKSELAADGRSGKFLAANNTFTPEAAFIQALKDRKVYLNVHSLAVPSGEIRGQVLSATSSSAFSTLLFGSEQVPDPVTTDAIGGASIELFGRKTVAVTGSFTNLSSPLATDIAMGAHLHNGAAGANGPVYQPLKSTTSNGGKDGMFLLDDNVYRIANMSDVTSLLTGNTYVNVHSTQFRSGEIRGQVTLVV